MTPSSSSSHWEQNNDWGKSNQSWDSWRTSSWCLKFHLLAIDGWCTQTHLPRTTFSHAQSLHRLLVGVYSHVPHITLHPLRAMSYTLQHSTPCTGTPSSPLPVQRSEQHSHDPRPQQRGTSVELPPPAALSGISRLLNSVAVHVMHSQKKYADVWRECSNS